MRPFFVKLQYRNACFLICTAIYCFTRISSTTETMFRAENRSHIDIPRKHYIQDVRTIYYSFATWRVAKRNQASINDYPVRILVILAYNDFVSYYPALVAENSYPFSLK